MRRNKSTINGNPPSQPTPSPSKVPLPPSSSTSSLPDVLEALSSRLSETESSLNLLLESPMSLTEQMESLPLLDRAKFYVTLTYAIDSLIFCSITQLALLTAGFLRTKGANFKDHPVMRELERVKIYIRKVNAAEQVPTDRTVVSPTPLIAGNLVVDKPAAQRMIMHSIPKNQIVPNPNTASPVIGTAQKRAVEEISSHESGIEEGEVPRSKKAKTGKCKSRFRTRVTRAENDTDWKSAYHKHSSGDEVGEASSRITHDITRDYEDEDEHTPVNSQPAMKRKSEKSPKKPKKKKLNGASESEIEVTEVSGGDKEAKKKKDKKDKKKSKGKS